MASDFNFIRLVARFIEWNNTSYERTVNEGKKDEHIEVVEQTEFTLDIPTMRERVRVSFPNDALPVNQDKMDQWESDGPWVVVLCDGYRNNAFEGKKAAGAILTFNGVDIREASAQEKTELSKARREMKNKAAQRRTAAKSAKKAGGDKTQAA